MLSAGASGRLFWWGFGVGSFRANPGVRFPSIILKMIDDKHGRTSDCIYPGQEEPNAEDERSVWYDLGGEARQNDQENHLGCKRSEAIEYIIIIDLNQ